MAGVSGYDPARLFVQLQNTQLMNKDQPLYQLLYLMIQQLAKLTSITGSGGTTPGGGTTIINQIIQQLNLDGSGDGGGGDIGPPGQAGAAGADGANGMVPYYIGPTETFTVPIFKQALFAMNIENDGMLVINGFLIEVDRYGQFVNNQFLVLEDKYEDD